jgi:hypothetical protein
MNLRPILGCLASAAVFCGTAHADETEETKPVETKPAEPEIEKKEENKMTTVIIETSMGTITVELDTEKAPITVANFLAYVDDGHYADTIFHRVIKGFMVQGGGFTPPPPPSRTKRAQTFPTNAGHSPWRARWSWTPPRASSSSTLRITIS